MAFTNSPLAKVTLLSPNHSGQRKHEIDTITIHCVVGQCSAKRIGEIFLPESRQASSNYGIGYDGEIGLYVEEKNRSWCSSSSSNDHRAITIEVASDTSEPYAVTDKAYDALIDLVTDICKRNNIKELKWKGDKSLIGQVDKQNMTVHRWFANKSCPGTYLYERHGQIATEVNKRLGVQVPDANVETPPKFYVGDTVKIKDGITTFYDGTSMASWVPKSTLYVRSVSGDCVVISTLKEGAITGSVLASHLVLIETVHKEDISSESASTPAVQFNKGDVVKIKEGVTTYYDGTKMASWVPKSKLYVRDFKDNNRIVISTLKEGAITGTVFASDLVLVEAAQKTEDKPVEVKPAVKLPGTPSTGSKADEKALWDFLLAKIGNEYGVAGLMGNLYAESALRSNNLQNTYEKSLGYTDEGYTAVVDDGSYTNFIKDSAGYGLAQWTFWSRKQGLLEYAKSVGKSIGDFTMQMEFLWKELSGNHKATLNALKSAQNVTEASTYVLIHFEAPADQGEAVQAKRASYGEKYYNAYHIVVEESKEEIEETIPEENTNQNDTNDGSVDKPVETPAGEDVTTEVENEPEYIQTPEEAQNFLMRLLNHVIDFIVRLFKK